MLYSANEDKLRFGNDNIKDEILLSIKCNYERKMFLEYEIGYANNVIKIIENSRNNALKKVNEELIQMYWKIGEYLSKESEYSSFGDAYIDSIAKEIQNAFPGIKGFTRRGLYRMKKFYETYRDDEFVTTLLTQISWSNHYFFIEGYNALLPLN